MRRVWVSVREKLKYTHLIQETAKKLQFINEAPSHSITKEEADEIQKFQELMDNFHEHDAKYGADSSHDVTSFSR